MDQWLETSWNELEVPAQALAAASGNQAVIAEAKRHLLSFLATANDKLAARCVVLFCFVVRCVVGVLCGSVVCCAVLCCVCGVFVVTTDLYADGSRRYALYLLSCILYVFSRSLLWRRCFRSLCTAAVWATFVPTLALGICTAVLFFFILFLAPPGYNEEEGACFFSPVTSRARALFGAVGVGHGCVQHVSE